MDFHCLTIWRLSQGWWSVCWLSWRVDYLRSAIFPCITNKCCTIIHRILFPVHFCFFNTFSTLTNCLGSVIDDSVTYASMGMARLPAEDLAIGFFLVEIRGAGPCRGAPLQDSWLRQTEAYLKDMDMTGLASAWAMARRTPHKPQKLDSSCLGLDQN